MISINEAEILNTHIKQNTIIQIFIIATLFFIFGFVSCINAKLIPLFKISCEFTKFEP